jgi:hypothetical protein
MVETVAHRRLKRLALTYLRRSGCLAAALEVSSPIGRYRVDAAGYRDRAGGEPGVRSSSRVPASTILVECKQCRSDFLRDRAQFDRLQSHRRSLEAIARSIEEHRIKQEEPHLRRRGSSLFPDLDEWDFAASRLPSYRKVVRQLRRVDRRLYGQTKFCMIARYRLADRLFVAAPQGMIRRHELPSGWGLLECPPQWLDGHAHRDRLEEPPTLTEVVPAPTHECQDLHRQRLLRNIAVAASFAAHRGDSPQRHRGP